MITDDKLTELLRDVRDSADGLDSAEVVAGAGRRRTRVRLTAATGGACAAVAAVALTATTFTGGTSDAGVAGGPDGTIPSAVTSKEASPPPAPARGPYVGKLAALPLGTIPAKGKVQIAPKYWFETRGTRWCITTTADSPEPYEPFGCRGTVGNSNIGDGTSPGIQSSGISGGKVLVSSVFKGNARRVIYTDGKSAYEAKVYRLAGVPGWVMSTAVYRPAVRKATASPSNSAVRPDHDYGVFAYDAAGKLIASFPNASGDHPLAVRSR